MNDERERDYIVTVRLTETFAVSVKARTAREAEDKVRSGDYDFSQNSGDRRWTSVKARRDD